MCSAAPVVSCGRTPMPTHAHPWACLYVAILSIVCSNVSSGASHRQPEIVQRTVHDHRVTVPAFLSSAVFAAVRLISSTSRSSSAPAPAASSSCGPKNMPNGSPPYLSEWCIRWAMAIRLSCGTSAMGPTGKRLCTKPAQCKGNVVFHVHVDSSHVSAWRSGM